MLHMKILLFGVLLKVTFSEGLLEIRGYDAF
jgi:hypothetical protein